MARASYIAPIIAFALGCLTRTTVEGHAMAGLLIGGVNVFLIVAGFCLAIVALIGMNKVGREGILGPAITGLVINVLIFAMIAALFGSLTRARKVASTIQQRQANAAAAAAQRTMNALKAGEDAVTQYPGWLGFARLNGGLVIVTEVSSDSPFAREFRGNFNADCSVISVAIDNANGTAPLTADPASLAVLYPDGRIIKALSPREVYPKAQADAKTWFARIDHPPTAAAGASVTDGIALLPPGTDLQNVTKMNLVIEGQERVVSGKYYSVEEKAELARKGEQAKEQRPPQQAP
jgi:hypothetical protein